MYELFYGPATGHSGPFSDLDNAIARARRLLVSNVSMTRVDVREYDATGTAGFGRVVAVVRVRRVDERDPDSIVVERLA